MYPNRYSSDYPPCDYWPLYNQDAFYRYPRPDWSFSQSTGIPPPPGSYPFFSPPELIVPWPSPASTCSLTPVPMSRDHHTPSRDLSSHDVISNKTAVNLKKEKNDDTKINHDSHKNTPENKTNPKSSPKGSPSSGSGSSKKKKGVKKRWSHRPKLRPPPRPEVIVSRSKRYPDSGPRYPRLSVLCYNVLSQDLISENMYLYNVERSDWLDWEYRKTRLLKELLYTEADIMCLQEVCEEHYYSWYERKLQSYGYKGLYLKRTGHCKDGCAIFYYTQAVELVGEVNYVRYQKNKGTLDRDNVGIIAKFKLRSSTPPSFSLNKNEFLIATTHLLFNPKAGEVKLAQICYLLAELHKMAALPSSSSSSPSPPLLPCILCGDFNSLPNSPLLNFLLQGTLDYTDLSATNIAGYKSHSSSSIVYRFLPYPILPTDMGIGTNCIYTDPCNSDTTVNETTPTKGLDVPPSSKKFRVASPISDRPPAVLTHPFNFTSCYPMPFPGTFAPTVTTYHRSAAETVDYILCTPCGSTDGGSMDVPGFHVIRRDALPSFNTLEYLGPQPNEVLSSDHLYLYTELQLIT